jgi:hypothetical protein
VFNAVLVAVPRWLLVGVGAGVLASLAVAAVFVVAGRLLPEGGGAGGRVDGPSRRRAEIRSYLGTLGESFIEDHAVAGERVAFYLPDRRVAITFDAHAYFRLEAAGVRAVLCEHEMPGAQLGRRLPFETPDPTPDPPAPDPVVAAYDRLGLPTTADEAEIRAAYRDLVKEVHPDRGGDEEAFKRVQRAYDLALEHA